MTTAHDKFLRGVMMREDAVREQIEPLEREATDALTHQRLEHELFGASSLDSSSSDRLTLGSPWDFQTQNAPFILAHEHSDAWSDSVHVDLVASEREHERALQASTFPATLLHFGADIRAAFGSVLRHQQQETATPQERTMSAVLVIERDRAGSDAVAWLDALISAHRQLSLSPYFPHLLGTKELAGESSKASHSDGATTLVCFEYLPVVE